MSSRRAALARLGAGLCGGAALATAGPLAGCGDRPGGLRDASTIPGGWIGADLSRGHRLRQDWRPPVDARPRRADVLIVGGGIAGLAAARALRQAGIDNLALLELEDAAGGNSRGHTMAGQACPLGAHYLPLPGDAAHEVRDWLEEIGLLQRQAGRLVADERHLCHAPQERLFFEGAWHDGLLPPAEPGSARLAQYRRFAKAVEQMQRDLGFALPTARAPWDAGHRNLDAQTFDAWLSAQGLTDPHLRWYLDYCCRDDYGAGLVTVSAWAGLHYFASRHGFAAPGDDDAGRDAVLTWPEGNARLVQRLALPLGERLHTGRIVRQVVAGRHGVQVWAEVAQSARTAAGAAGVESAAPVVEQWQAKWVVLALPLRAAARVVQNPSPALREAAAVLPSAPWLVGNLLLDGPPLDRLIGAPAAWDNVRYDSPMLGYVDAGHQRLDPRPGPTVFTAYAALPQSERAALAASDWRPWAQRLLDDLSLLHPDLPQRVQRIDLMRWGHAMAIPVPGLRSRAAPGGALAALAEPTLHGRILYAHSDLAGYSVFEEAFTHGHRAGLAAAARLHHRN